MYDVYNPKRGAAQSAENRHRGHSPEDELQVEVRGDVCAGVSFTDSHGEDGVGDHPRDDHVCADGAVVVFLLLGVADPWFGDFEAVAQVAESFVVAGIDVELFARHFEFDGVALFAFCGAKVDVDDVVAFCTPCDVVGVAESIDLEGTDVGREEGEVLCGGGEHMPGVEVKEGHEEVEANGGGGGDDEVGEDVVADGEGGFGGAKLDNDNVEGTKGGVGHDDGVDD